MFELIIFIFVLYVVFKIFIIFVEAVVFDVCKIISNTILKLTGKYKSEEEKRQEERKERYKFLYEVTPEQQEMRAAGEDFRSKLELLKLKSKK